MKVLSISSKAELTSGEIQDWVLDTPECSGGDHYLTAADCLRHTIQPNMVEIQF